ncbi:MAG: hypothetical protein KatS3mg126_0732 [Lysobacteraceae bacterium]|nr:MAG: hypothetical protein KatS3mg126_0732 [Xanthomonadaceae bacterium]
MKAQLGHYQIIEELGRGGMGVVYKGYEPALNRYVAIKELSPSLAHDPNLVERFLREARSMAQLTDPHIIQVYFIGTDAETGQPFFAMEFVEGESLSSLLKREGTLSVENALKLMHQAALGLATAHDKGVIHRDIKPGNLMITPRGQLKIADFGIALATQDLSRKLTSTGEFVGTPGYLSPEVCLGKPVDARSDIFALGIVLYEMLAGRLPFTDESPLGLMLSVVKAEIPDIRSLNEQVDAQTADILGRMLAKDPEQRFQDCHALAAALEQHPLVAKGGTVRLATAAGGATVAGAATPGSQAPRAPTPPPVVRAESASSAASPPPPPTEGEAPTAKGQAPRRPSVLDRPQPARRSSAPLWLAAAVLVLLVSAAVAFRGAIGEFLLRSDDPAVAAAPSATEARGTEAGSVAAEPTPASSTGPTAATQADERVLESASDAPPAAAAPTASGQPEEAAPVADASDARDRTQAPSEPVDAAAAASSSRPARPAREKVLARVEPPRPAEKPAPPRVAVVALGDRALADTAKQRIEERLLAEGFDVLDTDLVAGLEGRDLPGILRALRREATMLVVVRAEPIGSQQLSAYGQYFTLYSANLNVRSYLIGEGRPLGAGFREKVDFTVHNVNENTREVLAPHLSQLVRELAPHRRRAAG